MPLLPLEYLRHIIDETEYLIADSQGVSKARVQLLAFSKKNGARFSIGCHSVQLRGIGWTVPPGVARGSFTDMDKKSDFVQFSIFRRSHVNRCATALCIFNSQISLIQFL